MKKLITICLAFTLAFCSALSVPLQASAYNIPSNMEWWADSRFGMFIHFGGYSEYGHGEWAMNVEKISKKEYQEKIAAKFNPTKFNAKTIVSYAKKAGMKYIVITAKHHEGLAMWDTQVESFKDYTGQKIFSLQKYTPFGETGRDILMELKDTCEAEGIQFGLYYSIIDWNHSSQEFAPNFTKIASMKARESYIKDMKAQLQELVTKYAPAVFWFDGDWTYNKGKATLSNWWTKSDGKDLYNFMKKISPNIIVNERVCRGFNLGDFECPEQSVPVEALSRPWETCQTMNSAWGYDISREKSYRTTKSMVQELVTVASRDGNYLLNIGPKGDGTMTSGSKKILNGIGSWMEKNSNSIYGTSGNPFPKEPSWGTYTQKGKTVYAHVFKWPKDKKLTVSRYKSKKLKLNKVYLQNTGKKQKYTVKGSKITIKVPKEAPDKKDTVIVMEYK